MPTLSFAWSQRLAPARTVLSTSIPIPIAVDSQPEPLVVRKARMPKLELLLLTKPVVAKANSLPATVPRPPVEVRRVALLAEPDSSGAPGTTTLRRALG